MLKWQISLGCSSHPFDVFSLLGLLGAEKDSMSLGDGQAKMSTDAYEVWEADRGRTPRCRYDLAHFSIPVGYLSIVDLQ
jgi:hypothetical protein